ncbi:MAG: hypothetical protein FWD68_03645 [Alphaproteobacteria bacterium]|nr:hypothetical protein [Alphaproteobacteria bacterium]
MPAADMAHKAIAVLTGRIAIVPPTRNSEIPPAEADEPNLWRFQGLPVSRLAGSELAGSGLAGSGLAG